jgi:esterase/lipase
MTFKQRFVLSYLRIKLRLAGILSVKKAARLAFDLFCTPRSKRKKEMPGFFRKAETLEFPFNNQLVRGFRWNYPLEKKALVIHGFQSSSYNFERYIAALIKNDYSVIAFDAPAHGRSDGRRTNALEYANMLKEVIERYGPFNACIAHSFGGLAISLALENIPHCENLKLVLIAPATETSSAIGSFTKILRLNQRVKDEVNSLIYNISGKPTQWYSIRRAAKNIKAQVRWFHDEDDRITPYTDALNVKQDQLPNLHFTFTKGLGHRRIYRSERVRTQVINFLQ